MPFSRGKKTSCTLGTSIFFKREIDLKKMGKLRPKGGDAEAQGKGCSHDLIANGPHSVGMSQELHHLVPTDTEVSAFSVCLKLHTGFQSWAGLARVPMLGLTV